MTLSPSEFREEVEKLERKHAENPEGRYFVPLANAYRRSGDLRRAMSLLRQGLEKHPDYLSAHIVLGRCLADQGESGAAEAEFRYVLSLDPQNLIALRTLGELALGQRNFEDARKWYQELLSVDPMNEDARRALENMEIGGAPAEERRETVQGDEAPWEWPAPERLAAEAQEAASGGVGFTQENHESLFGTMIDPEQTGPEGDAIFSDEANAVVTETIAELYTRQGFYDRAADVYRELIRRRGSDPALEDRLRRVTELAAGAGSPPPLSAPAFDEDSYATPAALQASEEELPELAADPFAGSFEEGFSAPDSLIGDLEGASISDAEYPRLETSGFETGFAVMDTQGLEVGFASGESVVFAQSSDADEEAGAAPPWAEPEQVEADPESMTIGAYLGSLLSWQPAASGTIASEQDVFATPAGETNEAAADDSTIIPDDSLDIWAREGFVTDEAPPAGLQSDSAERELGDALPLMEERAGADEDRGWLTGSDFVLNEEPEPVAPASQPRAEPPADLPLASDLIDDELFPWELPAAHPAVAGAPDVPSTPVFAEDLPLVEEPGPREDPRETHVTDSDATPLRNTETPSAGPTPPSSPTPNVEAAANESKEDDDLESFQTWLRSLKR